MSEVSALYNKILIYHAFLYNRNTFKVELKYGPDAPQIKKKITRMFALSMI